MMFSSTRTVLLGWLHACLAVWLVGVAGLSMDVGLGLACLGWLAWLAYMATWA